MATCPNGHDLYVTLRSKRYEGSCNLCGVEIPIKTRCIVSTGKQSRIAYCMNCSGCPNDHVVHTRILNEKIEAKNSRCLRCRQDLRKKESVRYCFECENALCPDGCERRVD